MQWDTSPSDEVIPQVCYIIQETTEAGNLVLLPQMLKMSWKFNKTSKIHARQCHAGICNQNQSHTCTPSYIWVYVCVRACIYWGCSVRPVLAHEPYWTACVYVCVHIFLCTRHVIHGTKDACNHPTLWQSLIPLMPADPRSHLRDSNNGTPDVQYVSKHRG